jgi:hypothetical protein
MLPASTKGGGVCSAFPDVCKVPAPPAPLPVPTPFPNIGQVNSANKTCSKVLIENKETVCENSELPRSSGDEAGTLKGMVSFTNMDKVVYKSYSSKVYACGKKVAHVTSMTAHNGSNANMPAGAQVAPSQITVLVGI